jgi:DNA-binding response OmpR family regulator
MDMRVLVLTGDRGLGDLVRAQVENLGCRCTVAASFEEAAGALEWADAAIIDLAGDAVGNLRRLRAEAPDLRVLAVAEDELQAEPARNAWVSGVLVEPFSIADLVAAVRNLQPVVAGSAEVVDLRTGQRTSAAVPDDAPWWATR